MSGNDPERPHKYDSEAEIMRWIRILEGEYREWARRHRKAFDLGATDDMEGQAFNMEVPLGDSPSTMMNSRRGEEIDKRKRSDDGQRVRGCPRVQSGALSSGGTPKRATGSFLSKASRMSSFILARYK